MARTRTHVIETLSRRIVASLLPPEHFVERDQTERDYGIDMSLECFDGGEPSGAYLLLQLKGTDDPPPDAEAKSIPFDMKVKDLQRAERFATPVLLIWCPVQVPEPQFFFLWLQSYIRVVLNYDHPDWRSQQYIRLHIPIENKVPGLYEDTLTRLRHIAGHPSRVEQYGQLARITHEAPFAWDNADKMALLFEECLRLNAIFGDTSWVWAKHQRHVVEKGLLACRIRIRSVGLTDDDLRAVGWMTFEPNEDDDESRQEVLYNTAKGCSMLLLNMVATYFDDQYHNDIWKAGGPHEF